MSDAKFLITAARRLAEVVDGIEPDRLAAPTPCAEFTVRGLVGHLLFWGPSLEGAGRKEAVPPPDADAELTAGDWAGALHAQLDRTIATWREPAAWAGETRIVGPTAVPAAVIGRMITTEFTVHGWDLAVATGQRPDPDPALLDHVYAEVAATAAQGRQLGAYGPEVAVGPASSTLDKLLGLTGRDPAWRA